MAKWIWRGYSPNCTASLARTRSPVSFPSPVPLSPIFRFLGRCGKYCLRFIMGTPDRLQPPPFPLFANFSLGWLFSSTLLCQPVISLFQPATGAIPGLSPPRSKLISLPSPSTHGFKTSPAYLFMSGAVRRDIPCFPLPSPHSARIVCCCVVCD